MDVPEEKLEGLARHIFSTNQLLCSSCQVVYLDTDNFEEVKEVRPPVLISDGAGRKAVWESAVYQGENSR